MTTTSLAASQQARDATQCRSNKCNVGRTWRYNAFPTIRDPSAMQDSSRISPQLRNLKRLIVLRVIEVAGQVAVIVFASYVMGMGLPVTILFGLSAGLALVNLATWWRAAQPWPVTTIELAAHLIFDIGVLTALLYFAGGSTNPFVTLYLLPLSIAAALLSTRLTWAIAGVTLGCYTFLLFVQQPLPQVPESFALLATLMPRGLMGVHADFGWHVLGMWFNFALSAVLIPAFVARMAQSIRERDQRLAVAREQALRSEQLVALGLLAAGAAHELSTPLATMRLIATELEREHSADSPLAQDLRLLRAQADQCKRILTNLTADAGVTRAEQASEINCAQYLQRLLEQWQLLRPQITLAADFSGAEPPPRIGAERSLDQALMNLINNAADASPTQVEINGRWDAAQLLIEIRDRGPGISAEVAARAGEAFFTSNGPERGLGIGLFLANATIERAGGRVSLFNRDGGGACVRITLPLLGKSFGSA